MSNTNGMSLYSISSFFTTVLNVYCRLQFLLKTTIGNLGHRLGITWSSRKQTRKVKTSRCEELLKSVVVVVVAGVVVVVVVVVVLPIFPIFPR